MDEILQKLVSSELLSEETKAEITKVFSESVEAYKAQLTEEIGLQVRAELAEQWVKDKEALVESVDSFITVQLASEISELKEDVESFRDLEVEYAAKLVEEKHTMAAQLGEELDQLVDKIDAFLEIRLSEEMEELKEDLEEARQNTFGRKVFEAFVNEFGKSFIDETSVMGKLAVSEQKLREAEKKLEEQSAAANAAARQQKMTEILAPLSGSKREQMELILKNVETDKLQESFNKFVGRILKEDAPENQTLVESTEDKTVDSTTVVTGETAPVITEGKHDAEKEARIARLRKLASV